MDEPHSYDHYLPYQKVEAVQKTLNDSLKNKQMLTKIYPEWSGEKEGIKCYRQTWAEVAKPRKLMFWYYTIFNEQERHLYQSTSIANQNSGSCKL
jgi:hypothetical protein